MSLAITAALGADVGGAAAATLWTTPAHTTHATSFSFDATAPLVTVTNGFGTSLTSCQDSTINFNLIFRNDMTTVATRSSHVTFGSCSPTSLKATFQSRGWTLFFFGTGTASGTTTCWPSTMTLLGLHVGPSSINGNLTTGVTACQPTIAASPVTVRLSRAGTLSSSVQLDAAYTFTGGAATFSLTD
ncbi:MAG TPA: hypothetical protein VFY45_01255 [Baekduia sp.]|nr:hypothetical protein [Baekduia sp.]